MSKLNMLLSILSLSDSFVLVHLLAGAVT